MNGLDPVVHCTGPERDFIMKIRRGPLEVTSEKGGGRTGGRLRVSNSSVDPLQPHPLPVEFQNNRSNRRVGRDSVARFFLDGLSDLGDLLSI